MNERPTEERRRRRPGRGARTQNIVDNLLRQFEKQTKGEVKLTVTEAIRLMQFDKEIEAEQPKEVQVRWVDGSEEDAADRT